MFRSTTDRPSSGNPRNFFYAAAYAELIVAALLVAAVGVYLAWLQDYRIWQFKPTQALLRQPNEVAPPLVFAAWTPRTTYHRIGYSYFVGDRLYTSTNVYPLTIETDLFLPDFNEDVWPNLDYMHTRPGTVEAYINRADPEKAFLISRRSFLPYALILIPIAVIAHTIPLLQKWRTGAVSHRSIVSLVGLWYVAFVACAGWYFLWSYSQPDRLAMPSAIVLELLMLPATALAVLPVSRRNHLRNRCEDALSGVALGCFYGLFAGWIVTLVCHSLKIWFDGFDWAIYGAVIGGVGLPILNAWRLRHPTRGTGPGFGNDIPTTGVPV